MDGLFHGLNPIKNGMIWGENPLFLETSSIEVMAFDVGVICAMVSAVGLGSLIAQAALITGGDGPLGIWMVHFCGAKKIQG